MIDPTFTSDLDDYLDRPYREAYETDDPEDERWEGPEYEAEDFR